MDYTVIQMNMVTGPELEARIKLLTTAQDAVIKGLIADHDKDFGGLRGRLDTQRDDIDALAISSAKKTTDAVAAEAKRINAIVADLPKPPSIAGLAVKIDVDKAIATVAKDLVSTKAELETTIGKLVSTPMLTKVVDDLAAAVAKITALQGQVATLIERVAAIEPEET